MHIFVSSINFQKLDYTTDKILFDVNLENSTEIFNRIHDDIGFKLEQVCIVNKCNAVTLVITYFGEYDSSFVRGRLLSVWDDLSPGGLSSAFRHVKIYEEISAVKYITECALGIHSVTPGDSQVLSQVCDALNIADTEQQDKFRIFPLLLNFVKKISIEAKSVTNFYNGNVSLERIACELVKDKIGKDSRVLVLGAGKTSALLVKILSQEFGITIGLANRSTKNRDKLLEKYPNVLPIEIGNSGEISKHTHILIGLSSNSETISFISNLLSELNDKTMIIDLSSPSIIKSLSIPKSKKVKEIIDVERIAIIASERISERKAEADKVRSLVRKKIPECMLAINKSVAKNFIEERKKTVSVKLDSSSIELLRIRNASQQAIRLYYEKQGFCEVVTPYLVGVSSDPPRVDNGGVFSVDWPNGGIAFLRQSNQLYKQMIVASGMDKIFEIGPFWRAEENTTYRHLLEMIGLDVEFSNPDGLRDVYSYAYETILEIEKNIRTTVSLKKSKLKLPRISSVPVLTYRESVELLRSKGYDIKYGQDLGLVGESRLGQIIKKDNNSDALIVTHYPDTIKKFYTKKTDNGETETFDIIIDGWELVSGALRNTNRKQIEKSMLLSGVNPADYSFYLSVVGDAVPHGGFCLGLDRIVAKSLGLEIVTDASPFPRTAESLIP